MKEHEHVAMNRCSRRLHDERARGHLPQRTDALATALTALLNAPRGGRLLASAADAVAVTASPAYESSPPSCSKSRGSSARQRPCRVGFPRHDAARPTPTTSSAACN